MSSEIKNSIGVLCKLLNLLYETNLKPDYFRLAKFNKSDDGVVPILWTFLFKILDEKNTDIIKRKLQHLNYRRNQFYSCTEASVQSREILLVVGFLISIYLEDKLNNILKNSIFCDNYNSFENQQSFHRPSGHQQFDWYKLNEADLENYKEWLCGKTSFNTNMIKEYKKHISKKQEKFNQVLDIKANGSLTVFEILALKNKAIGEKFIQDTEPILNVLSLYTEWLKKEKYFWKWMESVLLEANKESKSESSI